MSADERASSERSHVNRSVRQNGEPSAISNRDTLGLDDDFWNIGESPRNIPRRGFQMNTHSGDQTANTSQEDNIESLIREEMERMESMNAENEETLIREEVDLMESENTLRRIESIPRVPMPQLSADGRQNQVASSRSCDLRNATTNPIANQTINHGRISERHMIQPTLHPPRINTPVQRVRPVMSSDNHMIQPTLHQPRTTTPVPTQRRAALSSDRNMIQATLHPQRTTSPVPAQRRVALSSDRHMIHPTLHPPRTNTPTFNRAGIQRTNTGHENVMNRTEQNFNTGTVGGRWKLRNPQIQRSSARFVPYNAIKSRSPIFIRTKRTTADGPGVREARSTFRIDQPFEVNNTQPLVSVESSGQHADMHTDTSNTNQDNNKLSFIKFLRNKFSSLGKFVRRKLKRSTKVSPM